MLTENTEFVHNKQTLKIYLYYRIVLSGILLGMFYAGITQDVLGAKSSTLYRYVSESYFLISLLSLFLFKLPSLQRSNTRLGLLLCIDTSALLLLIHSSGGIDSGIGYLLIVNTAIVSIFIHGQIAFAFAAVISIVIIGDTLIQYRDSNEFTRHIFTSGILGCLVFATSSAMQVLSSRLRMSAIKAEAQAADIRNLQEIAQSIVTRMQTGVIVVSHELKVELINNSAKHMLDLPESTDIRGRYLADLRELAPLLKTWENALDTKQSTIHRVRFRTEIRVNVAYLDSGKFPKYIFYLEDFSAIQQHAQQLKLMSLGRLAASIAHEIRNPLGALSHATQLLTESDALPPADRRLTEIIISNSGRVNEIIENTLAMSRRKEPNFEQINLATWLPAYINESHTRNKHCIHLKIHSGELLTRFDSTHLRQVLANLIDNALRYSEKNTGEKFVEIETAHMANDEKPFIEVKDRGAGIPAEKVNEIFEPFYTTDEKGTGLGLYISKELVEINHASLHYKRTNDNLSCFRIDCSHHQRMQ